MAFRVALIGTGNCGSLALRQLITDARFELTDVWVSSNEKAGKDAGELAGLDVSTGVTATDDLAAIVASRPECVVYCAMGDVRLKEAMADVRLLLAAGINVVGSAPGVLQYPWQVIPDKQVERVEEAAREGSSSVFITGVDPGFATDLVPFALAGTCQSIQQIRTMEIADYATYDGVTVMYDVMGFGNEIGDLPMLCQRGILSIAWGTAIRQLAVGLGVEIDEIRDLVEQDPRSGGPRRGGGPHCGGNRCRPSLSDRGDREGRSGRRRRARHPTARGPEAGLGAARASGRFVPRGDHR